MPGFVERLMAYLEVSSARTTAELLPAKTANASLHRVEVDSRDVAFIRELATYETALFEEARRRSRLELCHLPGLIAVLVMAMPGAA